MTRKIQFRIDTVYKKEIEWLKWYYRRDKRNPRRTILEQLIAERLEVLESPYHANDRNGDIKSGTHSKISEAERVIIAKEQDVKLAKYQTLKKCLDELTEKTEPELLKALREVYVFKNINLTAAASRYLLVSERTAYYRVKAWLEEFSDDIFNPRHRQGE